MPVRSTTRLRSARLGFQRRRHFKFSGWFYIESGDDVENGTHTNVMVNAYLLYAGETTKSYSTSLLGVSAHNEWVHLEWEVTTAEGKTLDSIQVRVRDQRKYADRVAQTVIYVSESVDW